MNTRIRLALSALLAAATFASSGRAADKDSEFFENKIRPILATHCYECHSANASKVKGGLLLDTRDGLRNGGNTGPAIVPGDPGKSLLIKALKHEKLKMPPRKQLPEAVVADFTRWVLMGAADPREASVSSLYRRMTREEAQTFWAFQPPRKTEPPTPKSDWARSRIDRFLLARLEEKGLQPARDADRQTLLRRLTFDLIGLPPSPEEIEAFAGDKSDRAIEKVVDRLLASKHFGERWGRHWLDLARYAESNGNADNTPFPNAWRYRDYTIKAFNEDRPYDRFITEQIAGDLLTAGDPKKKDELLVATGFLALTSKPRAQNNPDYRMDLIADQIDVTTRAVLGMTVMCARCHDHKFDYVSTKEYYALAGIFSSSDMLTGGGGKGGGKKGVASGLHQLSDGGEAMGVSEGKASNAFVCVRGETRNKGETVPRGFLGIATASEVPSIPASASGRLELAQWLTAKDNPLTARVAVNRVWQALFGRGIVATPDNFGYLGDKPTHPELLDWLAVQFMEDGWSMKKLIRSIVLTRAYQLASDHNPDNHKIDPDNRLLWRANVRRLQAEAIRDAILASSGSLDREPPAGSTSESSSNAKGKKTTYQIKDLPRRSVYLGMPRGAALPEILSVFDVANPNLVVAQREVTTVPVQALFLMNSPFVLAEAKQLAKRLQTGSRDEAGRIDLAYKLTLSRTPTSAERDRVQKFLRDSGGKDSAWTAFCHALYAAAEFRYVE